MRPPLGWTAVSLWRRKVEVDSWSCPLPEGPATLFAFFDKGRHVELIDVLLVTSLSTASPAV
jgi:hypothetical protein